MFISQCHGFYVQTDMNAKLIFNRTLHRNFFNYLGSKNMAHHACKPLVKIEVVSDVA